MECIKRGNLASPTPGNFFGQQFYNSLLISIRRTQRGSPKTYPLTRHLYVCEIRNLSRKPYTVAHEIPHTVVFYFVVPIGDVVVNFKSITCKLIIQNSSLGIRCEIGLVWMQQNFTDEMLTLVQVMVWSRQTPSHYLNQYWPRCVSPYSVIWRQWVKSRQLGISIWNKWPNHQTTAKHTKAELSQCNAIHAHIYQFIMPLLTKHMLPMNQRRNRIK